ncbi:YphA family membrane protein [Ornithinibacillus xuwenensis]|uniref:Uncharacterized protein n=1 Tax=Ornithinibacillus xuwenensis TaxID=3144668 RepID=A0ABU9XDR6_9BACI
MEGVYFYWFCWLFWIVITFLMPKSKKRTVLAVWLLVIITVSNLYLSFNYIEISMSFLLIIVGSFISISLLSRIGFSIFSAFTIMIGFTSLLIWEAHAPVWIFMPRLLIIPIICVLLITFIAKGLQKRMTLVTLGLCGGEFLYSVMVSRFSIRQTIGEREFLDTLLIVLFILVCLEVIQKGREKFILVIRKA